MLGVPGDQGLWVRRFHDAGNAFITLVCFPHAGGTASYFFRLSAALSPDVKVCAIQYPGRQDRHREPFVETIDELADRSYAALNSVIDGPVALFGHSMGAVLAFEVARQFEQSGHQITPTKVFVSARRAPSRFGDDPLRLGDDAAVVEEMRKFGGTDPRLLTDPEMLALVLPAFRNDFRALEQYRRGPEVRIRAPIVVMAAVDDPSTTVDDAMAWHEHTTGGGAIHTFEGGHFYLEQQAGRVITVIAEELRGDTASSIGDLGAPRRFS